MVIRLFLQHLHVNKQPMREYAPKALITDCTLFNGYKPCLPYKVCEGCPDPEPHGRKILIINLDNIIQYALNIDDRKIMGDFR